MTECERLIELLGSAPLGSKTFEQQYYKSTITKIADYLLANGVIVPPCKVGDVVYVIFNDKIHKATVHNMKIETENDYYAVLIKVRVFDQISLFKTFLLGKTVFLAKEEAEKALKGVAEE